jgi:hypothetical protein
MTRWLLHDVSSEDGGSNGDTQYHPTPEEIERGCERWLAENPGGRASNCPCEEALRLGKKVRRREVLSAISQSRIEKRTFVFGLVLLVLLVLPRQPR